jgi:hypothetical protein
MRHALAGFAALTLVVGCAPAPYLVAVAPRPVVVTPAAPAPLAYRPYGSRADCREEVAEARLAERRAEAQAADARRAYAYGAPPRVVRREADQAARAAARAREESRDARIAC